MSTATQTKSLVVVAIPAEDDRVWKISSEKVPHLTLLFLGDADKVSNFASIVEFVQHAASTSLQRVYLPVDRRGELGEAKADVLFFKKGRYDFKAVRDFRNLLLKDANIKTAYDSTSQFEFPEEVGAAGQPWIPHLTLGYPDSPAKPIPDDQMSTIYDVRFDRIAVWDGDFEGPEFELKDYWDEMDELGIDRDAPLSVAWSNLEHHGVKGMKWGERRAAAEAGRAAADRARASGPGSEGLVFSKRTNQARASNKSQAMSLLGPFAFMSPQFRNEVGAAEAHNRGVIRDAKWKKQIDKSKKGVQVHNKAADEINAKLPAFNSDKRWKNSEGGRDISKDPAKLDEYNKAFEREIMNPAYAKAAIAVHGSESPGGRYKFEIKDASTGLLSVTDTTKVKHAAEDDLTVEFKIIRDANGYILGFEPDKELMPMVHEDDDTPDLMAMVDAGAEFLEHHGVKGMRWGQRKDGTSGASAPARKSTPGKNAAVKSVAKDAAKSVGRGARKVGRGAAVVGKDIAFESTSRKQRLTGEVHSAAAEKFTKEDIPRINAKYADTKGGTLKGRLKSPLDPNTRAYRSDSRIAYRNRVNEAVKALPGNASGTRKYEIEDYGKTNSQYGWTLRAVDVKKKERTAAHADISDELPLDAFVVRPVFDDDGFITDIKMTDIDPDEAIAQADEVAEFLAHHGVKGMRWGQRKAPPTAVAPTATSHVPHGRKSKTKIETDGGENHPASEDAIKVAQSKAKLAKSGTHALSNKELQEVANRVELEQRVKRAVQPQGKRFVANLLKGQGQQGAQALAGKGRKKAFGF